MPKEKWKNTDMKWGNGFSSILSSTVAKVVIVTSSKRRWLATSTALTTTTQSIFPVNERKKDSFSSFYYYYFLSFFHITSFQSFRNCLGYNPEYTFATDQKAMAIIVKLTDKEQYVNITLYLLAFVFVNYRLQHKRLHLKN